MTTKTITLGEAAEAIHKNGYPKASTFVQRTGGKVTGACAIGQGALNLGCTWQSLRDALNKVYVFNGVAEEVKLGSFIMTTNDSSKMTVEEIGATVAKRVRALNEMPLVVVIGSN